MTDRAEPPAPRRAASAGPSFATALKLLGAGAVLIGAALGTIALVSADLAAAALPGVVVTAATVLRTRRPWWGLAAGAAMAVAGGLAAAASTSAIAGGILMGVVGVSVGLASRAGLRGSAITVGVFAGSVLVAPDPPFWEASLLGAAAATAAAILLGAVAMTALAFPLARRLPAATLVPSSWSESAVVGAALAIPLGISAAVLLAGPHDASSGWLLATMIVLVQPDTAHTLLRSAERAGGTALGALVAAAIGLAVTATWAAVALALVAATYAWAYRVSHPAVERGHGYWIYAAPWTMAIVLLAAPAGLAVPTAEDRALLTALGALIAAASVPTIRFVGTRLLARWRARVAVGPTRSAD